MALWSIPVHTANMAVSWFLSICPCRLWDAHCQRCIMCLRLSILCYWILGLLSDIWHVLLPFYFDRCATGMVSSIGTLNQRTSYMQTSRRVLLSSDVDLPIFFSDSCSNFKPLKPNMETLIKFHNIFPTLFYYLIFHPCKMELTLLIQFIENLCTPTRRFCFPHWSVPPIPFDPCVCVNFMVSVFASPIMIKHTWIL